MTQNNDGGPAYPFAPTKFRLNENGGFSPDNGYGMSLRDYFAGQALAGLMAGDAIEAAPEKVALACYTIANAMIAERSKP